MHKHCQSSTGLQRGNTSLTEGGQLKTDQFLKSKVYNFNISLAISWR